MGDRTTVGELVIYNRTVLERFERAIARRSWREAIADRGTGHLSLKNTLVHILNVHEAWLVAIAQERWEVFDRPGRRPDEIGSWKAYRAYRARVWAGIDELMGSLKERDLSRRVKAPWMPGRYTLKDAFFQSTIEQAHHLGEVIGVFWQHDWRPPKMTWIENLRQR